MENLTEKQEAALARDKNIAVTAGAGTGKTRILVDRYLDILLHDTVDIRRVLAITYTTKAAAEMVERVAVKLDHLLQTERENKKRKRMLEIRNRLSSAYISTIHAFCNRLLREYPVEAGLDPDFGVMTEMQSGLLAEQAIADELNRAGGEADRWINLFRIFGAENISKMLKICLARRYEMISIRRFFDSRSDTEIFDDIMNEFLQRAGERFPVEKTDILRLLVKSIAEESTDAACGHEKAVVVVQKLESFYEQEDRSHAEFWNTLFTLSLQMTTSKRKAYRNAGSIGGKSSWSPAQIEALIRLSEQMIPVAEWIQTNPSRAPGSTDRMVIEHIRNFIEFYERVLGRYTLLKQSLSQVDFEDLQLLALELLQRNEAVREKIANQFRYVMIDEFQDTNGLQWEIARLLEGGMTDKYFIVGDPKQSIYGFRGADVRVFESVKKIFAGKQPVNDYEGNITLDQTFRFKENLNTFFNHLFMNVLNVEDDNPWQVGYEPL